MMLPTMWRLLGALLVIVSFLAGCVSQVPAVSGIAFAATDPASYARLGLSPTRVEPWEDGMRTSGGPGSYEWWYFDFTLDDGSTLVIVFYTKDFTRPGTPLEPFVTFQVVSPGGKSVGRVVRVPASQFAAAKDRCDVKMGASTVRGDLGDYAVHFEAREVRADLRLHATMPAWRPATGQLVFRRDGQSHFFAWLPAVPQGTVEGTLSVEGRSRIVKGTGYHDHNWGDASVLDLIHDWYWGRAQVGPYTVIASRIVARQEYGNTPLLLFMLARDGKIVADDPARVAFHARDVYTDSFTAKPVAGVLVYEYADGSTRYRVTFTRERDINRTRLVDTLNGLPALLARLSGFDGAYLRFTGPATVERMDGESVMETATEKSAVWELMYLGHVPKG